MDTKQIFDKNNIEFFPQGGTLLGFIREQRIMPWDADIDLVMYYKDYHKLKSIGKEFEKLGYKIFFPPGEYRHPIICDSSGYNYYMQDWGVIHQGSVPFHISIDFFIEDGDRMIMLSFFDKNMFNRLFGKYGRVLSKKYHKNINKKQRILTKFIDIYNFLSRTYHIIILFVRRHRVLPKGYGFKNKKQVKIYGKYFDVPQNPEKCLELVYGSNWIIPDKNWTIEEWNKTYKPFYWIKHKIHDKNVIDIYTKRGDIQI